MGINAPTRAKRSSGRKVAKDSPARRFVPWGVHLLRNKKRHEVIDSHRCQFLLVGIKYI